MKDKFERLRSRLILAIVSIGLVVAGQTWAQTASVDYEKAVLVSKFARYIEWSPESDQKDFVIGIYDDAQKHQFFSEFFANKGVKGKDIEVRLVKASAEAKNVHILYVPNPNRRRAQKIAEKALSESNILIVTEGIKDLTRTMIDLAYNSQSAKIGFSIIEDNIAEGNLIVPELSNFTSSNDDVLSVSPTFAKQNEQANRMLTLQNRIAKHESTIANLNKKIQQSNNKSKQQLAELRNETERLTALEKEKDALNKEFNTQNAKLKQLEDQLAAQQDQLNMSKNDLTLAAEQKVKEQAEALEALTAELTTQKSVAQTSVNKLAEANKENSALSTFRILFFVFAIIALVALFLAFTLWKKAKAAASQSSAGSDSDALVSLREEQLIKSENLAAFGYIGTDISYAAIVTLEELQEQLESNGDTKSVEMLAPVVSLLDNFNLIAADQDETEVQQFDIVAYIKKMLTFYDYEFAQSNVKYNYSGVSALLLDSVPSYVALSVMNIINNALKHGFDNKGNGKITLDISNHGQGGAKLIFADDGKGMSKSVLEQVFNPFFTTAKDRGYVGLGMSNTYDLITNKLNGNIEIDSKDGKGTTVTITLK